MVLEQLYIHPHAKKLNLGKKLTFFTKINSKWITDLNVKCRTVKCLEEITAGNLCDLGLGEEFLDMTPKVQFMNKNIQKMSFIKIKNVCSAKDTVKKMKRPSTDRLKISANRIFNTGFISRRYFKNLKTQQ